MTIFDREEELNALRRRLESRKPFLLHGASGVGKTLLLEHMAPEFNVLYCQQSSSSQAVFRALAEELVYKKDAAMHAALGRRSVGTVTTVSVKGIVTRVLHQSSRYTIILDHLNRPSHSLAAVVRELTISCSVPVVAVARSAHMEDAGFVAPLFPDRGDKFTIKNFDPVTAENFVRVVAAEQNLVVDNFSEFVARLVEFSGGNPGAIVKMVRMAGLSKYRLGAHVKLSPLYIDFRVGSASAGSK